MFRAQAEEKRSQEQNPQIPNPNIESNTSPPSIAYRM